MDIGNWFEKIMWCGYKEFKIVCHTFLRNDLIVFLFQNCIKRHVSSRLFMFLWRHPERYPERERERWLQSRKMIKVAYVKYSGYQTWYQDKMEFSLFFIILCEYSTSAVSIMPELKCNVLRF